MNEFLIVKTIKVLFQLSEEYRSSLTFKTYLNVDNFHVFTEEFSRAEENLNNFFNKKRFTTFDENFTHFISDNHFSWRKFLRIVLKQQKNAIVQFVSSVFSTTFVITSINTKKMLKHVTKKNSKFTFLQKTAEVSFRLINDLQQYVKKSNSFETFHLSTFFVKSEFFVVSKIKTTSEFDYSPHRLLLKTFKITKKFSLSIFSIEIESFESKKTKSISAKQFIVHSKFSNSEKSSIQISLKKK